MNEYCSYEDLDEYQALEVGDSSVDDVGLLRGFCTTASRLFDGSTRRVFYPRSEVRYYDHPSDDASRLRVDDDLLEVTTFTTQNGEETVAAADYYLMCGTSYNLQPYDRLVMLSDGDTPVLLYSDRLQKANALTAIWGYHEAWASAWQSSNDALAAQITAAATSLTVADVDGKDIYGLTPRFKVQQLIKIDDEYLYVTGKNAATDTLTVRRGVNGTTAAIHAIAATIYIYQPMEEIAHAVKRLAAWLYAQRNTPYSEMMTTVEIGGTVIIPKSAPPDVALTAAMYRRSR